MVRQELFYGVIKAEKNTDIVSLKLYVCAYENIFTDSQSEMYVWRSAGYIRKSLFIFGYL